MGARLRLVIAVIAVGLAALGAAAPRAAAAGAVLDPSFGSGGLLRLPAEFADAASGAAIEGGGTVVSEGSGVRVLDGLGATGAAFGGTGTAAAPAASGDEFEIDALNVDTQGRLLILGETVFPESENPSPYLENGARAFRPSTVRIVRLLPDGALDPTFGQGGVVETDLGFQPPPYRGHRLGPHPAVEPSGIAVDGRGRIVITGSDVIGLSPPCRGHDSFAAVADGAGFVARLTEDGELDPQFGTGGVVGGRGLAKTPLGATALGEPIVTGTGAIYVRAAGTVCKWRLSHPGIALLTPEGRLSRGFGKGGEIRGTFRAMAIGRDESLTALAEVPRRRESEPLKVRLLRLRYDDYPEGSFGKDGWTTIDLGRGFDPTLDSIAVDPHKRVLIGGRIGIGAKSSLALLRVSAEGRWERHFGPRGRIVTPMPGLVEYGGRAFFLDSEHRLVTARVYSGLPQYGGSGLLVARYLLK
jgi:hypothetical protein